VVATTTAASITPRLLRHAAYLLVIPAVALSALALAGNARADGSLPPFDPSAAAPLGTSATTDQSALAGVRATQEQPSNVVNSSRVDSPGDDGAITQSNAAQAQAAAANGAATTQGGGGDQGSQLDAATQQAASAVAAAIQQGAQNIVIQIRINSPGDNGPINQSNVANAGAGAVNASETSQGGGTGAAAPTGAEPSSPDSASPDAPSAVTPAAPAAAPAEAPAAEGPAALRRVYPAARLVRPRAESPQETQAQQAQPQGPAAASNGRPSAGARSGQAPADPPPRVVWTPAVAGSTIDASRRATPPASPVGHAAAVGAGSRAAEPVFKGVAGAVPTASESLDGVSNAVLLTLVALIVGLLGFVGSTYAPAMHLSTARLRLRR
jgi:hypothetical protein